MKIWRLDRWDWDSCGECRNVQESWYFTTLKKARERKLVEVVKEIEGWMLNGPTRKDVENNFCIEEVEVL